MSTTETSFKQPLKNQLVQIYSLINDGSSTIRSYPYPQSVKSLKAYVRSQNASERLNSDIQADNLSILAFINWRPGIKVGMFLEYLGTTYQIKSCDPNYFKQKEWKIVAVNVAPIDFNSEEYLE
jgi:hypothetical protein